MQQYATPAIWHEQEQQKKQSQQTFQSNGKSLSDENEDASNHSRQ